MTSLTEKLQKLIAHEKSARAIGNLQEAEAFAAKIAELLFRHNLSMSDVEIKQQERDEPIARERVSMGGKRAAWMEILASAVSTACFCKWLIVPGGDTQVFVGRTSDREAAASMYRHLVGCATSICNMEKRSLRDRNPYTDLRQRQQWAAEWGKSFLLGFSTTVATRLRATRQQLTNESGGTALVLRKDAALQQWWAQQNFKGHARSITVKTKSQDGFATGIRAGHAVSLKARSALNA